jgi:ABC-type phosphate/phosphonate transport system substrate-binding protein
MSLAAWLDALGRTRRSALAATVLPALAALGLAAAAPAAAQVQGQTLVLAVNEGVTYRVGNDEIRARYAAVAADLGKLLGHPVRVEPVGDYPALRKGLAAKAFDLALVHPAHISIGAIKGSGYQLVAVTKGWQNYSAHFLVRADSPLKTLADLSGRRLGAPDEDSITAWMMRAALRDARVDPARLTITYTRYQDAVPFMVTNGFTQAGVTASTSLVRQWEAGGGKVLARSRAVPIKHVLAGPGINAEQLAALRQYFVDLDSTEAGRRKLEPMKVEGYAAFDTAALLALGVWLGL